MWGLSLEKSIVSRLSLTKIILSHNFFQWTVLPLSALTESAMPRTEETSAPPSVWSAARPQHPPLHHLLSLLSPVPRLVIWLSSWTPSDTKSPRTLSMFTVSRDDCNWLMISAQSEVFLPPATWGPTTAVLPTTPGKIFAPDWGYQASQSRTYLLICHILIFNTEHQCIFYCVIIVGWQVFWQNLIYWS